MSTNERQRKIAKLTTAGELLLFKEIEELSKKLPRLKTLLFSLRGKDGDKGEKGDKGDSIQGEQGEKGRDGKDGKQGKKGDTGKTTDVDYVKLESYITNEVNNIKTALRDDLKSTPIDFEFPTPIDTLIGLKDTPDDYKEGHLLIQRKGKFEHLSLNDLPVKTIGGGGSLVRYLHQLLDVTIDTPVAGDVLTYNKLIDQWENSPPTGGGGGHTIQDEGIDLTQRTNLNFVGTGVVATDDAGNDATVVTISGGGVTDHGALTGLSDDDHPQYHNDARADTWLSTKTTDDLTEGVTNLYNISTDLSEGTSTTTTVDVNSSDGTNATLQPASTIRAGVMSKAKFDEVVVNNAKVSNATHTGDVTGSTTLTIATNAVETAMIEDEAVTNAKLADVAQYTLKGRKSGGTGVLEDFKISSLTTIPFGYLDCVVGERTTGQLGKLEKASFPDNPSAAINVFPRTTNVAILAESDAGIPVMRTGKLSEVMFTVDTAPSGRGGSVSIRLIKKNGSGSTVLTGTQGTISSGNLYVSLTGLAESLTLGDVLRVEVYALSGTAPIGLDAIVKY